MKKMKIKFIILSLITITLFSCQKIEFETNSKISINDIKSDCEYVASDNNFDYYIDDRGTKLIIPKRTKTIGIDKIQRDKDLTMQISNGSSSFICSGKGNNCYWDNVNHDIYVCN